jgi:hypothetical protein
MHLDRPGIGALPLVGRRAEWRQLQAHGKPP